MQVLAVRYLTTEQVAERLGKSTGTLRNWRSFGEGPQWSIIGNRAMYPAHRVEEWCNAQDAAGLRQQRERRARHARLARERRARLARERRERAAS